MTAQRLSGVFSAILLMSKSRLNLPCGELVSQIGVLEMHKLNKVSETCHSNHRTLDVSCRGVKSVQIVIK